MRLLMILLIAAAPVADKPVARYLDGAPVPDLVRILPPPPAANDPRAQDDRATFAASRSLRGSERWRVATRDVTDDRFTVFACAIGARLDATRAPALARVFARMGDGGMVGRAKAALAIRRPYLDQAGEICKPRTAHLAGNGDYPSGHTSNGWATALVLAELLPARATEVLERGRIYGESRYICGSHSRSAVEAGFMAGAVMVSQLHASATFRRDMDRARTELDHLAPDQVARLTNCDDN